MPETLLDQAIISIYNTGFFDYALPFVVTFVIIYGLLQRTMLLGKEQQRLNAVFALVVSLIIMPFAAQVNYTTYLSKLIFIILKFIALAMILGLLGFKFKEMPKTTALVLALLATAFIVVTEFFNIGSIEKVISSPQILYILLTVFTFGIVVWLITGSPKVARKEAIERKEAERPREARRRAEEIPPEYGIEKVKRIPGEELEKPGIKFRK